MKTKGLASLVRRTPITIAIDLVRFLPNNRAVIGIYDKENETIFVGLVDLSGSKVRSVLRGAWRNKHPRVNIYRDKDHQLPVCTV